ncbi:hypothetical protein [Brevibacillus brevis]|uniref:Uncharacterized protein n=1 Tax=Brevibacillus brevis TaxID=1393 RepID=A0ABY9TCP3_BREBE|nr:hypothetical protein [Brevibacillus brevis]WNC17889.1 hypothetical protein RGB73_30435 [Brevibacillus brevis]
MSVIDTVEILSVMESLVGSIQRNCIFLSEVKFEKMDKDYNPIFNAYNTVRGKECSVKVVRRTVYIDNGDGYDWVFSLKRP